jgi:hypothetical protein
MTDPNESLQDPAPVMPTKLESARQIARGLLPYIGDWYDLSDGLAHLRDGALCLLHLTLRIAMMALFPLTLVVLFPFVRTSERRDYAIRCAEAERRAKLIADLTVCSQKPIKWPSDWTKQIPAEDFRRAEQSDERAK